MKYIRVKDAQKYIPDYEGSKNRWGNIHRSGSVRGMVKQYGWKRGHAVRIGSYIYHLDGEIWRDAQRAGIIRGGAV